MKQSARRRHRLFRLASKSRPYRFPSATESVVRILLIALVVVHQPAMAAIIVVDGSTCNLVDAITAANSDTATGGCSAGSGADMVQLTTDVTLTVVNNTADGANGLPSIDTEINVTGIGGSPQRAIARDAGAPDFRIFHVAASGTLELDNLSLMNGNVVGGFPDNRGGAIFNNGHLTLTNSSVSGNTSSEEGGAIVNNYSGTLILTSSTLTGNSATFVGGGIFTDEGGTVTLTDSTIAGNSAANDGGGIFSEGGIVTLSNSTISGNSAANGGGIRNYGGTLALTNSTLSGNSATNGGGIYSSYTDAVGETTLTNSTLSGNSATNGGGVFSGVYSTVTLANSIIADSTGGNCDGSITDSGNNLADDDTCGAIPATPTDLDLTLADNEGPTLTHALLATSSAINQAGSCGLGTDQRGAARRGACDSGAFEFIGCELLEIDSQIIDTVQVLSTCNTALLGPDVIVEAPAGDLTVNAGYLVTVKDGFWVDAGAQLAIGIDPSLLPP